MKSILKWEENDQCLFVQISSTLGRNSICKIPYQRISWKDSIDLRFLFPLYASATWIKIGSYLVSAPTKSDVGEERDPCSSPSSHHQHLDSTRHHHHHPHQPRKPPPSLHLYHVFFFLFHRRLVWRVKRGWFLSLWYYPIKKTQRRRRRRWASDLGRGDGSIGSTLYVI